MTVAELDGRGGELTFLERTVAGERPRPSAGRAGGLRLGRLGRTGFPAARSLPDAPLFLDGYAALVAQRAGDEGRDASRLLTTLRVLATLEAQAVPSAAFHSNRLKRLTSYPKRYLADVALLLALAGVDTDLLVGDPTLAGRYLESYVMQQLRPQVDAVGGALTHLRTGAGEHEVDAVVEVGGDVYAVEVKLGLRPAASDADHLVWLRDHLGDRFVAGFVVHCGAHSYALADRIWAIPITDL